LYGAGLAVKDGLRDAGLLRQRRLAWPVISVGSLSAGGAGKTPVVKLLARLAQQSGMRVDVLSRGFGRASAAVERVDPEGNAGRFGDEPLELARAGIEVFVGAERYAAGLVAEEAGGRGVHVLDDGFQHRQLARDLDVALLTAEDATDWLLPAGNLREPLRALGRADAIVVREEEAAGLAGILQRYPAAVWVIRRRLRLPDTMPKRPIAFCGIARPEGFFGGLAEAGCASAARIAFSDHHRYPAPDVARLAELARVLKADGFVTTAKDEVKLGEFRERLQAVGMLAVAEIEVELVDESGLRRELARLAGPSPLL
jgi:tetraacyldisaccharide 4'-kinase